MAVSLPFTGVSINPCGVELIPATLDLPAQGVSLQLGVSITGSGGGVSTPSWLPLADGTAPKGYADFGAQNYWYNGATVADWTTFLSTLSGTLDGSSSRYYTNVAGTLVATTGARFDYDPVTHVARGILLEGARTNVLLNSGDLSAGGWSADHASLGATTTGPDGTASLRKVIPSASAYGYAGYYQSTGATANAAQTISVYAKAGGYNWLGLTPGGGAIMDGAFFDLQNGVVGTVQPGTTAAITPVGGGIYRCSVTRTTANTYLQAEVHSADNQGSWTPNGTDGIYMGLAQREVGGVAFASSYIPTTSGSVTRAADSLVFTPISGWFNAAAGSVFSKLKENGLNTSAHWSFNDNTAGNELKAYEDPSSKLFIRAGAATSADFAAGSNQTVVVGTSFKIASAFASNDAAHVKDNGTAGTDASVTIPAVDRLSLGAGVAGAGAYFGTIEQFGYWTTRVSNAGLQTLTT